MNYIAFDMDGTLFDCADTIFDSYTRGVNRFKNETGINVVIPAVDTIRSVLGMTADNFFRVLFPDTDSSHYPVIDRILTDELSADVRKGRGLLYDGVADLLSELHSLGWKILIASNGQYQYLSAILETYTLDRYLAQLPTVVNYKDICTKSDILATYVRAFSIDVKKDTFIMVGDRSSDLKAARDNNAYFIGCSFGHADDKEIEGADEIVHEFKELKKILL